MPKLTNLRHEAFALATASGAGKEEACEDAGLRGDIDSARRLAGRGEIIARIAELRQEQADLDEAGPTAVIIALVRMARGAERLKSAAGMKEARLALRAAQRLHAAQSHARHDARLTVLDDEEYDAFFRSLAVVTQDDGAMTRAPFSSGH